MSELKITAHMAYPNFTLSLSETLGLDGVTALFGPSGAGKSTLLRLIAGLEHPDEAVITFKEKVWTDSAKNVNVPPFARGAAYMFQNGKLFTHLSVLGNLNYALKRRPDDRANLKFEQIVDRCKIEPLLARRVETLSGGERQRVSLARILLSGPELLLLDEPLSGLDGPLRSEILSLIRMLSQDLNLPVLYVSHDIDAVRSIADRIMVISRGKITKHGPAIPILNQLYQRPQDICASLFEAELEYYDTDSIMACLAIGSEKLYVPTPKPPQRHVKLRVFIKAQAVSLATQRPKNISIRNMLKGKITTIHDTADTGLTDVHIKINGADDQTAKLVSRITTHAAKTLNLTNGQTVYALIKTASLITD